MQSNSEFPDTTYSTWKAKLILMSKGMAMGTADIIPGVSGGTIALISGIYDHFIRALDSIHARHLRYALQLIFFGWNKEKRTEALHYLAEIDWQFLIPLTLGITVALGIMINVVPYLLEDYSFYAFSFFFGLIVFSITVPFKMMSHRWQEFLILIAFALFTFFIVTLSRVSDASLYITPDAIRANPSLTKADIMVETNQKGQWDFSIAMEDLIDAGDPRCPHYKCLLLPDNQFFTPRPPRADEYAGERIRLYTTQINSLTGASLGSVRLAIAAPDVAADEYASFLEKLKHSTDKAERSALADLYLPRAIVLQSDLKDITIEIHKVERLANAESDRIAIHGSLTSAGNHSLWFIFLSGALAICAMVLPGISGAYILVLLGQYHYITTTARDLAGNLKLILMGEATLAQLGSEISSALLILGMVLAGILVGLFSFVRILKFLLNRFHSVTMAALTGLMIGSLRYIWAPNHFTGESLELSDWLAFIGLAIAGGIAVFSLELTARKLHDPDAPDPE